MTLLIRLRSWLRATFHRSRAEREMDAELRFHIDAYAEDLFRAGVPRDEALRRARVEFGGLERAKEECRDATGANFLDSLVQDIRFGFRQLRKSPGFAAVAVLTLALGIGANTAIFSLIDAVMLRSMPVRDPQGLVVLRWQAHHDPKYHGYSSYGDCGRGENGSGCSFSIPLFERMRTEPKIFSALTAFSGPMQFDVGGNGPATIGRGEVVSGDFFETMGLETRLGRPLGLEDDTLSAPPVAVLSFAYWNSVFGGDPSVVGRTLQLNGVPCTIVGVTGKTFTNLAPGKTQDFFLPIRSAGRFNLGWLDNSTMTDSQSWWVVMVGRLKTGISLAQAQAAASSVFNNEMLHAAKPLAKEDDKPAIVLEPATRGLSGQRRGYSTVLYILMSAVGFVLLIACANVAGLTLARSTARQREMAVRIALGGGRWRIARQLLTESVMLSLAGGALGMLLAQWGVRALQALFTTGSDQPFPFVVAPDWRVFAFTLAASVFTGLLFGIAPALCGTQVDLAPALQGGASTSQAVASRGLHLRGALVVAQVALSILVLVGAGLLVRTLQDLRAVDPGFDTHNVLLFEINPSLLGYTDERIQNLYQDLRDRFAAIPGVVSASYASDPLLSGGLSTTDIHLPGDSEKSSVETDLLAVGPEFLSTLHIPLLDGRNFTTADFAAAAISEAARKAARLSAKQATTAVKADAALSTPATVAAPVPVLVNDAFVKRYFPKQSCLGRHLDQAPAEEPSSDHGSPGFQIVGVVGNTKYENLRRKIQPAMYVPLTRGGAHFELRTAIEPAAVVPVIRNTVNAVDNNLPVFDVRTQSERIEQLIAQERIIARLSSFFGLLALLLACIGLYGLLAYEVTRRTREIGIRVALGAQQSNVVGLVIRQGIVLVILGCAFGVAAGAGLTQYLRSLLFGVEPVDPLTFVGVVILLFVVALGACYIPARRAAQVDPMVALRHE
jgi:predicted permease